MSWPWKGASRTAKIPILFIFKRCRRKYISKHWGQMQLWRTPVHPEWSNRSPWTLTQDCVCSILLLLFAKEECDRKFIKRYFRIISQSILTLKTLLKLGLRLHFIAPFGLTPSGKYRFTFNNKRTLQVKSSTYQYSKTLYIKTFDAPWLKRRINNLISGWCWT